MTTPTPTARWTQNPDGSWSPERTPASSAGGVGPAGPTGPSGAAPLTTKGDLLGFSTLAARVPIGADATVLTADSTQALGLKWAAPAAAGGTWAAWTPTFTADTGTPTTVTINKARYTQTGKTVTARLDITITDAGTAGNGLRFTLPVAALDTSNVGVAREILMVGTEGVVITITTALGHLKTYNNGSPWSNGQQWLAEITYEVP